LYIATSKELGIATNYKTDVFEGGVDGNCGELRFLGTATVNSNFPGLLSGYSCKLGSILVYGTGFDRPPFLAFPNGTVAYNLTNVIKSFDDAAPVLDEKGERIFVQGANEIVTFLINEDGQTLTALASAPIVPKLPNKLAYDSAEKNLYFQTNGAVYRIEPPYDTFPSDPLFILDPSSQLVIDSKRRVGYVQSTSGLFSFPLDSKKNLSPVKVLDLTGPARNLAVDTKTGNLYFIVMDDVYEAIYMYKNAFYTPTIIFNNVVDNDRLTRITLHVEPECPDDDDKGKKGGNDDGNSDDGGKGKKGGNDDKNGDDEKGKKGGIGKGRKDGDDDENGDDGKGSSKKSKNSTKDSEHRTSVRTRRLDEEGLGDSN
jgi:hypothetical protein